VNNINVTTSQAYTDVSVQISITDQKPQYIPSLILHNENEFVESYITIDLLGDNCVLSGEDIQSMTMTIKIKKNANTGTQTIENQIYVLSYETKPFITLVQPLIQEIVSSSPSGVWEPITPLEITEDEEFIYYQVETSSYYAAYAVVEAGINEIQPYQSGIPEIPWGAIVLTVIVASALLVIVLYKTDSIYRIEDTDGKNKEKFLKDTNQKYSFKLKLSTTLPELQTIRSPTFYFPTTPQTAPQIVTASTHIQDASEESEEDPMYL
jgi:hypothetical protein